MHKILLTIICLLILATQAMAYTTVGFRAYSSAAAVGTTCTVLKGAANADGTFLVDTVTTASLGTKGTTSVTPVVGYDYKFLCVKSSDGAAAITKMFFDTEGTNLYPMSTFLLKVR